MIESHWEGIAAYINSEEKVSLGFVEGLNNKIRVIQRRAYGVKGSRILTPQGPHLHVTGTVSLKSYPLDWEKTLMFFLVFLA